MTIIKETTKTGADVAHDLKLCPIVQSVLSKIPNSSRVGPLIIDETSGRPYAEHAYAREWRIVARAAGIPDRVWNMDARAGGISEADDAGADLDFDPLSGGSHTSFDNGPLCTRDDWEVAQGRRTTPGTP